MRGADQHATAAAADLSAAVYRLVAPRTLTIEQQTIDTVATGDAIVAMTEFSVVSPGTELAAWLGHPPLRPSVVYPRLVGYCNLARVVSVGGDVTRVRPGDYVVTHQAHRSAFGCREREALLVLPTGTDETVRRRVTATYLYHLGYSALLAGGYIPGHEVAIIGAGVLGIATAELVHVFGGAPVVLTAQPAATTPLGAIGVTRVHAKREVAQLVDSTPMRGFDLVINTSNDWSDHLASLQLGRRGGTVVCLGFPGRAQEAPAFNPLDPQFFYDKQLTIRHCGHVPPLDVEPIDARFTLRRNMEYLASLVTSGRIEPDRFVSVERSWRDLPDLYADLATRIPGIYSARLDWRA